jgi:hypothetical protein
MGNYRLSVVKPGGRVLYVYEVNCDCDAAAYHAAASMLETNPIDVTQGERLVASIDPRLGETVH